MEDLKDKKIVQSVSAVLPITGGHMQLGSLSLNLVFSNDAFAPRYEGKAAAGKLFWPRITGDEISSGEFTDRVNTTLGAATLRVSIKAQTPGDPNSAQMVDAVVYLP